ncbi:MAG: Asp-tRNA(Asn)/Glu-tRNA(Gln) amidotransferase subunit GatA, partial [Planctomycetes bacterium]|nr:Asp-tRNA(Asn)/Glu-tRNA(Gln) amidotransferase subunit GatA [Planctomycetota bacterium]
MREAVNFCPAKVDLSELRVGYVPAHMGEGCSSEVAASVRAQIDALRGLGASIVEIEMPMSAYVVQVYYVLATSEASSNLSRFDGIRYGHRSEKADLDVIALYHASRGEGFGEEVKRRIMLGTFALSAGYQDAYFKRAMKVRALITQEFEQAFAQCDVLLGPTAPTTAFGIGEVSDDPLAMYLNDIYTIGSNLAGHPSISIPCGFDAKGLPIGLQLQSALGSDGALFDIAEAIEESIKLEARSPAI